MVLKRLLFASVASLTDWCQQTVEFGVNNCRVDSLSGLLAVLPG